METVSGGPQILSKPELHMITRNRGRRRSIQCLPLTMNINTVAYLNQECILPSTSIDIDIRSCVPKKEATQKLDILKLTGCQIDSPLGY